MLYLMNNQQETKLSDKKKNDYLMAEAEGRGSRVGSSETTRETP
jgi:hypothetical protein